MTPICSGQRLGIAFQLLGTGTIVVIAFVVIAILFAQWVRNDRIDEARSLAGTQHGLRCIGEAMVKYRDTTGELAVRADTLLSWRVHLLPFLGETELYREFRLDEPWNSGHNIKLVSRIPRAYEVHMPPGRAPTPGTTCYLAVVGRKTLSDRDGPQQHDSSDEWKNVAILVQVEPSAAVIWTKPDDWEYDSDDPLRSLNVHTTTESVYALTLDGGVWAVPTDRDNRVYDQLFLCEPARMGQAPFAKKITFN